MCFKIPLKKSYQKSNTDEEVNLQFEKRLLLLKKLKFYMDDINSAELNEIFGSHEEVKMDDMPFRSNNYATYLHIKLQIMKIKLPEKENQR